MGLLDSLVSGARTYVFDAGNLEKVAELRAGGEGGHIAVAPSAVWISTPDEKAISRFDPRTRDETARHELKRRPGLLHTGEDDVVALVDGDRVQRIDATTGEVRAESEVRASLYDLAVTPRTVWVLHLDTNTELDPVTGGFPAAVVGLDSRTLEEQRRFDLGTSLYTFGLAANDGAVAVTLQDGPASLKEVVLDASSGREIDAAQAGGLTGSRKGIGVLDGSRFLTDGGELVRRDAEGNRETGRTRILPRLAFSRRTGSTAVGHGAVWICVYKIRGGAETEATD